MGDLERWEEIREDSWVNAKFEARPGLEQDHQVDILCKRIAELEAEVQGQAAVRSMTVGRLGGEVEGKPTHSGNFLQRIDELRGKETELARLTEANSNLWSTVNDFLGRIGLLQEADYIREQISDPDALSDRLDMAVRYHERGQEELARLTEANRWIPVEERLPDDGDPVLLWSTEVELAIGWLQESEWTPWNSGTGRIWSVTHWRPLLDGPTEPGLHVNYEAGTSLSVGAKSLRMTERGSLEEGPAE